MICCYSKNFIFIKTTKTGSTSAEILLSSLCNKNDVFTPFINYEEIKNNTDMPLKNNPDELLRQKYTNLSPKNNIEGNPVYEHMTANELKLIDNIFFEKAFKFCIERHPYEKIISQANHKIHAFDVKKTEYNDLIDYIIADIDCSNKNMYTEKNKIIVDKVVQYNQLEEFLQMFCAKFINKPITIPKVKNYKKHLTIKDLSKQQKLEIFKRCEWEFKNFNYDSELEFNQIYV